MIATNGVSRQVIEGNNATWLMIGAITAHYGKRYGALEGRQLKRPFEGFY